MDEKQVQLPQEQYPMYRTFRMSGFQLQQPTSEEWGLWCWDVIVHEFIRLIIHLMPILKKTLLFDTQPCNQYVVCIVFIDSIEQYSGCSFIWSAYV